DWSDAPTPAPPFEAGWQELDGEVRHTFTHFHLILRVMTAELPAGFNQNTDQELITRHHFRPSSLPTVMRKAFDLYKGR
ncbi:A/G-specific adenine glycosylase, partial [Leisingera sp. ANG59]